MKLLVIYIFFVLVFKIIAKRLIVLLCLAGYIDGVIFPNGDVALCEFTKPFINLHDFNLDFNKLWNSSKTEQMRHKIQECFCTHPCNLSTSMSFDPNSIKRLFL